MPSGQPGTTGWVTIATDTGYEPRGMSRTSFNTRFRATIGQPPMAYLTELRLRRAAGYLATTTKSVRETVRPPAR
jgi:transcriptional regulator GlxA family with amidase domain